MTNRVRLLWAFSLFAAFYGMASGIGSIQALRGVLGPGSCLAQSAFTHIPMLVLSLILIYLFSKGEAAGYGLRSVPIRVLPKVILVSVVVMILGNILPGILMVMIGGREIVGEGMGPLKGMSGLQFFTSVFILASVAEEFLYRGLIQSLLAPLNSRGVRLPKVRLSVPVILAAVMFGVSHLILIGSTPGPLVVQIVISATFLGLVAGYYREKTGSIVPAIVAHMVFNVPGLVGKLVQGAVGA